MAKPMANPQRPRPQEASAEPVRPPRGLRVSRMRVGAAELAVLTFPIAPITWPDWLTEAERAIAQALLAGESNAQIATARATSAHTVSKQVSALLRRLGVQSRAEAVAFLSRPPCRLGAAIASPPAE
jgi:DNA-binding NarL/FixJ family response regulator